MRSFRRFISGISALTIFTASVGFAPIGAAAAETDAEATHFAQMRCNNTKTHEATATGEIYYGSGYLVDILTGKAMSVYNADPELAEYAAKASAELKTSAREYALMRIKLNSNETERVDVRFTVQKSGKTFSAYGYECETSDWTADIPMTDYNHTPNTAQAADVTYAVSLATGIDWSQKDFAFAAVGALAEDTSEADNLIDFSLDITDADNEKGYKDIVIVNNTSADDNTHIMAGTPVVSTTLQTDPTAEPETSPSPSPTAEAAEEPSPTAEVTEEPSPTAEATNPPPEETSAPAESAKPLLYNKFDMSRATAYRCNIADKSKHSAVNGGEVKLADVTFSEDSGSKLIDGDDTTVYTTGQSSNFATLIDLGVNVPVSKIVVKGVSGSAIIGLAGADDESDNGTLSETETTLTQNWARLNNSSAKNLTSGITVEYGTNDGVYDIVTLSGEFGSSRYVVFDGNGSNSKCAEIEVYYDGDPLPEPTPSPTKVPSETQEPAVKPTSNPVNYPEGAIVVKDQPKSSNAGSQTPTIDSDGNKREVAYTNQTAVWYLGNYELANIDSVEMRLGLVGQYKDGDLVSMPQVKLAYMPLDGSEINDAYINANSSAIRSSNHLIAQIEGLTEPASNAEQGHLWLGALYTVDETGVRVDSEGYAVFPGGNATLGSNCSPLKTDAVSGKAALFIYADASSRRAAIDYVVVNEKVLTPTELRIVGEDTWVIRGNAVADYTTNADAYRAALISDLGTEMKYETADIFWSVEGSDYISMKSPSGANSVMTAETELPIGTHEITLKAEYERDGITLTAEKRITVEKRESSVPESMSVSGEDRIELLKSQLPAEKSYAAKVLDQFGAEMEDVVIDWSISGDGAEGYSIENGILRIGETALSAVLKIKAASRVKPDVAAEIEVEVDISEYPSMLYATADVLFRTGDAKEANLTGADIEVRNNADADRGFSGGLKFNISTLREAVSKGYPINAVSIRFTTSISKDNKLLLKELSNEWSETGYTENSFDSKKAIIEEALASAVKIVNNDDSNGAFTLNRMNSGKRIYEGELGDTETIESWQTTLDIKDYIENWLTENPDEDEISFLLAANYNGTNSNTIFTKDIDSTYANWSALAAKFPQLEREPQLLYPAIVIDYAKENVEVSSKVDSVPIPSTDGVNSIQLSAVHYNPFTEESDSDIIWSISRVTDEAGNAIEADGISISGSGVLSAAKNAAAGTVIVRATAAGNKIIYGEKAIAVIRLKDRLYNGSFENINDAVMPLNWTSYDPAIDDVHNGVQRYQMDQSSEPAIANFLENNDTDGYLSGTHSAEDPTGVYGKKTVKLTGAHGIDKDYAGQVYTNNAANSSNDGGPDLRVTYGITYWVSQDYHLENFYQLNSSSVVGPYIGYEGFQGTTSKSAQLSGSWYIKDGTAVSAYTTDGYDTLTKQVTIPQNVNRLRINWGLTGSEGNVYYRNFRMAPQGIDTSKTAVDGENTLKVTGGMEWTSDGVTVIPSRKYTYKLSVMSEASAKGLAMLSFMDAEGNTLSSETIEVSSANVWTEKIGETMAPENAAYAALKLANGSGTGSVWYDNVILTETTAPVATYAKITGGSDMAVAPLSGESANSYRYTAVITDQYNNTYDGEVVWSVDGNHAGISIRSNGSLVVTDAAESGVVTIRAAAAENIAAYAEKTVTIIKKSTGGGSVSLENGDFSDYDESTLLPNGWTNAGRIVSIANGSFDSSISGWKLNYTSYTNDDTAAVMEWDSATDHTGNSGGAARIHNANRAQGSMQISQNIEICGGNPYDVSVWVKTDNVSDDSNVYATLIFYDENGSTIEENKNLLVLNPGASNKKDENGWTKLSGSIYANPLAVKLRIDMRYRGRREQC